MSSIWFSHDSNNSEISTSQRLCRAIVWRIRSRRCLPPRVRSRLCLFFIIATQVFDSLATHRQPNPMTIIPTAVRESVQPVANCFAYTTAAMNRNAARSLASFAFGAIQLG